MIRLLLAAMLALLPTAAHADVTARFYSRDFGSVFPHTFFEVEGPGEGAWPRGSRRAHMRP